MGISSMAGINLSQPFARDRPVQHNYTEVVGWARLRFARKRMECERGAFPFASVGSRDWEICLRAGYHMSDSGILGGGVKLALLSME